MINKNIQMPTEAHNTSLNEDSTVKKKDSNPIKNTKNSKNSPTDRDQWSFEKYHQI